MRAALPGAIYAWSTVGAIAGTFAAGYLLLSTFGMYHTLLGAALILTLMGACWCRTSGANRVKPPEEHTGSAGAGLLLYLFAITLGGVVGGFVLVNNQPNKDVIAQVESNYYTIRVSRKSVDEDDQPLRADDPRLRRRYLRLDRLLHSVVDPEDPTFLFYPHEHIQMEFLWLAKTGSPRPKSLVIGGGGYPSPLRRSKCRMQNWMSWKSTNK